MYACRRCRDEELDLRRDKLPAVAFDQRGTAYALQINLYVHYNLTFIDSEGVAAPECCHERKRANGRSYRPLGAGTDPRLQSR